MVRRHTQRIMKHDSTSTHPSNPPGRGRRLRVPPHILCFYTQSPFHLGQPTTIMHTHMNQGGVRVVMYVRFLFNKPLGGSCFTGATLQQVGIRPRPHLTTPAHHSMQTPPSGWSLTFSHLPPACWQQPMQGTSCTIPASALSSPSVLVRQGGMYIRIS